MALEEEYLDTHIIKWITMLVLLTHPDEKTALRKMEFLVLDSSFRKVLH